jgi:hypothetical protein
MCVASTPTTPYSGPFDVPRNLIPDIRASLQAKIERLLGRPLITRVVDACRDERAQVHGIPPAFTALRDAASSPAHVSACREDPEGETFTIGVAIDYDDVWRGCEKEVRETVAGAVESTVTFLTEEQKELLLRAPRQFLALSPRPESTELCSYEVENIGGAIRIVKVTVASAPESPAHVRYIAILPNLVQLERQLAALDEIEKAADDGPLAPLRALVGAREASILAHVPLGDGVHVPILDRLDEHQRDCVQKALSTPHFAVIEGPPGSGKTTVITAIVHGALARGEDVLVVSPTHVAVDNVVEKLVPRDDAKDDALHPMSLPVRFAARPAKLSKSAHEYWIGAKAQRRGASVGRRVEACLRRSFPFAGSLFDRVDENAAGRAPLTGAVSQVQSVICGTPIGLLSFDSVKDADAGAFGLLIVDEVSKMTLAEFLAIAVKARRWVLVGDPWQLPPYNNSEENGTTLLDVVPSGVELVCSVGAILERARPATRRDENIVVVARDPERVEAALRAHLATVMPNGCPAVGRPGPAHGAGILVCNAEEAAEACAILAGARSSMYAGPAPFVRLLVEHGLTVPRPDPQSVVRLVESRERAHAQTFETAFTVYHAQPWADRSQQRLRSLGSRNGPEKYLPSEAVLDALDERSHLSPAEAQQALLESIATRYAINAVSVYDWLTGGLDARFDTSPLREIRDLTTPSLTEGVRPFVGTLRKQYRMHSSLSRVPRQLFYFDEALHDGGPDKASGNRFVTVPVVPEREDEWNDREVDKITELLEQLGVSVRDDERPGDAMIITPYRAQEARLIAAKQRLEQRGALANVRAEICTLDRCQGREADYVFISLVRSTSTAFLDSPKRWNVALTRAKEGLFLVGNIDAYRQEAARARGETRGPLTGRRAPRQHERRPLMSVLARIIEAVDSFRGKDASHVPHV